MSTYKEVPLYGGAITVQLPTNFADVSAIREVPDHQEVHLDRDGFTSIIVDILEYVDSTTAPTDAAALEYHFNDMVDDTGDVTQFVNAAEAKLGKMPNTPCYTLSATQTAPSTQDVTQPKPKRPEPDFTGILMLLIRLQEQQTDIVITVNVPHVPGEYVKEEVNPKEGKLGPLMEKAVEIRGKILESFEIKDWELFVN